MDVGLRPVVQRFAYEMERTLQRNEVTKGKVDGGWQDASRRQLINKLLEEVGEVIEAVHGNYSKKAIRGECSDVANVAMMLADTFGAL
jgi:NTP pyrophosphatase (non-canonical NTP hydrolase)